MLILVTGSTGYIGNAVVQKLIDADHKVTAVVRSQASALKAGHAGATAVIGDITDSAWLAAQLREHDGAIHAASPGDAMSAPMDDAVIGAAIDAFGGTDKPFVLTGGIWSYGNNDDISETSPNDGRRHERERRLLDSTVKASVVEPGIVYGNGAGIPNLLIDAPRTSDGGLVLVGSGDQHWTTVHVYDLAELFVAVLENAPGGARYLGVSGENPTVRELGQAVAGPDGKLVAESVDATRERLGTAFADFLLIDQQASGANARETFGWNPSHAPLVEELANGYR